LPKFSYVILHQKISQNQRQAPKEKSNSADVEEPIQEQEVENIPKEETSPRNIQDELENETVEGIVNDDNNSD
jgi:hypothetical protein